MNFIHSDKSRRSTRRAIIVPCVAVATDGYRFIGHRILDLSPRGVLVTCGTNVQLGEELLISLRPPGDGQWMNVEAEVTRIVQGYRSWDPGPCVGVRFKNLDISTRGELLARIAGIPPTIPRRPLRRSVSTYPCISPPPIPLVKRRPISVPTGVWKSYRPLDYSG